jgi:hypothetical protein
MITCEICKKLFKRITGTHLNTHDLTTTEYSSLYPDAETISSELRHSYGKAFREANPMHNEESKNKVIIALTDRPKSEEHKKKLSESRTGKSWGSHTEEYKINMAEISKENMKARLENGWRPPKWTVEQRLARSKLMMGNSNGKNGHHNKGRLLNLTNEQRMNRSLKRSAYLSTNKTKSSFTSIELECAEFLLKNNIEYISQFIVVAEKCSWVFDFYIPSLNLLIEVDGEFWHSKPKQINRDLLKTNSARELGYNILRLSDTELNFNLIFEDSNTINQWSDEVIRRRLKS